MQNRTAINYLSDLSVLIKEKALEAKARSDISEDAFDQGYALAFYDIVSLMQSQATAFGISPAEISLGDIDADRDLL
jgi:hypothetical protein